MENNENMVEWITGQHNIGVTLTDPTRIRKIKKFYDEKPDEFKAWVENADGSVFFKVSKKWLKLNPPRKSSMTDEQRQAAAERLRAAREKSK